MNKIASSTLIALISMSTSAIAGGDVSAYIEPQEDLSDMRIPAPAAEKKPCYIDRTVVDYPGRLMWQDQKFTLKEENTFIGQDNFGKVGEHSYAEAYCNKLNYAGYTDWRLPTSEELQMAIKNAPQGRTFLHLGGDYLWTQSPHEGSILDLEIAGYKAVDTRDGYTHGFPAWKSHYIKCVRCLD